VVPVPLRLDHGYSRNNEIKLEFHFEQQLPDTELITGTLGPAATPEITAALPQLPYQIALKLMTLAANPVGIDETVRAASVPRQIYDVDLLLTGLSADQWTILNHYIRQRYEHECRLADVTVADGEPFNGIRTRLERWGNCLNENSEPWITIRAAQQTGLQHSVHLRPWGWRARAYRLIIATEALREGEDGWHDWESARTIAGLVPANKAKAFRTPLAELSNTNTRELPLELDHFVWTAIDAGPAGNLHARLTRAYRLLQSD
jgi:hypothetical protein